MSSLRMVTIVLAASITGSALIAILSAATHLPSAVNNAWGSTYRQWEPTCSARICHRRWSFSFLWCNYSDGCKAMYRTLQGVSKEFVLIGCVLRKSLCLSYTLHTLTFTMRTNSVLTPCKQGAVLSRYSDSLGTFTLLHFFFQWE